MKGSIYKLENKITKEVYIGQSTRIKERLKNHYRNALTYGLKGKLYDSIREYGKANFEETIILTIEKENKDDLLKELSELEDFYINKFNSKKIGLNKFKSQVIRTNGLHGKKKRSVNQYDIQGNFIKTWDCIRTAAIENETSAGSVVNCCKYRSPTASNYIWQYSDEIDIERVLKYIENTYLSPSKVKRLRREGIKPKREQNTIKNFNKEDYLDKW